MEVINDAQYTSVYGAIKVQPNLLSSRPIEQPLLKNPVWYVGTESRLSEGELERGRHYLAQLGTSLKSSTDLPLQHFALDATMQNQVFAFNDCNNAHLKFLLTWNEQKPMLLLGTTTFDLTPRDCQDRDVKLWYEVDENGVDFMAVIKSPYLIRTFVSDLSPYLPDPIQLKVQAAFKDIDVPAESLSDTDKQTVFAWGPKNHQQQLLELINNAQRDIKILQQDLTDLSIQQALRGAAHRGVNVNIIMSETPFLRSKQNAALPFLQDLTKIGTHVVCQLTGCVGYESLPVRHIHAKFLAADDKIYIGSANFYSVVLDPSHSNLNVGIITSDARYTTPLLKMFNDLHISTGSLVIDDNGNYAYSANNS